MSRLLPFLLALIAAVGALTGRHVGPLIVGAGPGLPSATETLTAIGTFLAGVGATVAAGVQLHQLLTRRKPDGPNPKPEA